MKAPPTLLFLTVMLCLASGSAMAGGTWHDKVNYRYSSSTSLKITDPDGFKATVVTADESKSGTVPELFGLPDRDAFVTVTITAPDGTQWTKKVEVRAKQQTELSITFVPDAPAKDAEPKRQRTYFGKLLNQAATCKRGWGTIKADFIDADGNIARSAQIDVTKVADIELAAGTFDVRIWVWVDNAWSRALTSTGHQITKDGWAFGFGCRKGSKSADLIDGNAP